MKTVVIPAQITTVEDKIAGNFNLTQIMLLMAPVFWTVIVYVVFMPALSLALYKIPVILLVLLICLTLAVRIKEKVVLSWVLILLKYNLRPKYYLFDKNDSFLRTIDMPKLEKARKDTVQNKALANSKSHRTSSFSITDLVRLEGLISNPSNSFSLKSHKKGGLRVFFEQTGK